MRHIYRSPYEAYTFLSEEGENLRCDFEILTDKAASLTGLLAAKTEEDELKKELLQVETLLYHLNPSLRTGCRLTREEVDWLHERMQEKQTDNRGFVLPAGTEEACLAHVLRSLCKEITRMAYRAMERGVQVEEILLDTANLLSGYFFYLALWLNRKAGRAEIPFTSRNYAWPAAAESKGRGRE